MAERPPNSKVLPIAVVPKH